jgi:hypothetical protein
VLTADLKQSREKNKRSEIQNELKNAIRMINDAHSEKIFSPFTIVWGDSFQGVLNTLKNFYEIIEYFNQVISIGFRCGIGIGTIDTEVSKNPLEMDGPAFYYSREALTKAKKTNHQVMINSNNNKFDSLVNSLLILVETLKNRWTSRQKEIIYLKRNNKTYKEIGLTKRITKQAVNNILKSANWKVLSEAIDTLNTQVYQVINLLEEVKP